MKTIELPQLPISSEFVNKIKQPGILSYTCYSVEPGDVWIFPKLNDLCDNGIFEIPSGISGAKGPIFVRATLIRKGSTSETWFPLNTFKSHANPMSHSLTKRNRRKHCAMDLYRIIEMIAGKTLTVPKRTFTLK